MRVTQATFRTLRLRYNVAYTVYQSCVRTLSEAGMSGEPPSADLIATEAKATHELTKARRNLLDAITLEATAHPSL